MRAICFVDMPFGRKTDLSSGVELDFDRVYETAIEPAIGDCGLEPVRGDRERTGGIIHMPMFGRLLLSDYVVADLTLANANVFYELGIRHTARPYTTVPIHAALHPLPFDLAMVRAIPYALDGGRFGPEAAGRLRAAIRARLEEAIRGAATRDSPLFQLIPAFPTLELPHEVTEIFQDQVRRSEAFRGRLAAARALPTDADRLAALREIERGLGDPETAQSEVLVDLLLSYRDVSAWDDMVRLSDRFSAALKRSQVVEQQRALALNRRNGPGDRDEAVRILEAIVTAAGPDPETLGILGRIHKDRYTELKARSSPMAPAALDDAIAAYVRGFHADPRDYFPGVNAITLLIEKGEPDSLLEAERLLPLVTFAVARRGGAASTDYWDLATVLELGAASRQWLMTGRVLPRVLASARAAWMIETTRNNLALLQQARRRAGETTAELDAILEALDARGAELRGGRADAAAGAGAGR